MSIIITPRHKDLTSMMLFPTQQEGAGEEAETDREKEREREKESERENDMQMRVSETNEQNGGSEINCIENVILYALERDERELGQNIFWCMLCNAPLTMLTSGDTLSPATWQIFHLLATLSSSDLTRQAPPPFTRQTPPPARGRSNRSACPHL